MARNKGDPKLAEDPVFDRENTLRWRTAQTKMNRPMVPVGGEDFASHLYR